MANAVLMRVMPNSPEEDLEAIKDKIKEEESLKDIGEKEIAFGLKGIMASFLLSEEEGSSELEDRLREIEGVREVEIEEVEKV